MRILVYLAALAIFLFIVNLGARWLSDEPETIATEVEAPATATPAAEGNQQAVEPGSTRTPASRTALSQGPEPAIGAAMPSKPAAPARSEVVAVAPAEAAADTTTVAATAASAAPEPTATEPAAAAEPQSPGALERLANSAQGVAEDAADTVSETIAAVSAIITGSEVAADAPEPAPEAVTPLVDDLAVAPADARAAVAATGSDAPVPTAQSADAPRSGASVSDAANSDSSISDSSISDSSISDMAPDYVKALLRRHPGQTLVVMFWEPGSASVAESFEWLTRVQSRYGHQKVHTIAVNLAAQGADRGVATMAHATNVEQRSDPERILARAFWVQEIPSIFIVRPDGGLHKRIDGFDSDRTGSYEDSVRRALRR